MKTIGILLILVILLLVLVSMLLNKLNAEFDAMRKNIYSNFNTVSALIDNMASAVSRLNTTTNALIDNINTKDNNNKIKIEYINNNKIKIESILDEMKALANEVKLLYNNNLELTAAIKAKQPKKVSAKRVNKDSSPVRDETKK